MHVASLLAGFLAGAHRQLALQIGWMASDGPTHALDSRPSTCVCTAARDTRKYANSAAGPPQQQLHAAAARARAPGGGARARDRACVSYYVLMMSKHAVRVEAYVMPI